MTAVRGRPARTEWKHGTSYAYRTLGCRCGDCTRWRREKAVEERRRNLERFDQTKTPKKQGPILTRHPGGCDCDKCDDYDRGMRIVDVILKKGTAPFLLKVDKTMSADVETGDATTATPTESKACYDCGHEHRTMASASRKDRTRYFCHENDHSCYNDRLGKFFAPRKGEDPYGYVYPPRA